MSQPRHVSGSRVLQAAAGARRQGHCKISLKFCSGAANIPGVALHPRRVTDLLRARIKTRAITVLTGARTHAGREVDFVLHAADRMLAIEVKAGRQAHRTDARPLAEALSTLAVGGVARHAWRLGLVITRGREVEQLADGVWTIPDWRLFGAG